MSASTPGQRIAQAVTRTRVGYARQMRGEGAQGFRRVAAAGRHGGLDGGPGGRKFSRAQLAAGARDQFAHPELFGPVMGDVVIGGVAREARGGAGIDPAADLVGRAAKELRVHETFGEHDRVLPGGLPVLREPGQTQLHRAVGQVGQMTLGQDEEAVLLTSNARRRRRCSSLRQHEETAVVDDQAHFVRWHVAFLCHSPSQSAYAPMRGMASYR